MHKKSGLAAAFALSLTWVVLCSGAVQAASPTPSVEPIPIDRTSPPPPPPRTPTPAPASSPLPFTGAVQGATATAPRTAVGVRLAATGMSGAPSLPHTGQAPVESSAGFSLEVPSLGYSAAVSEGTAAGVLLEGPGHYPETAQPGGPGNVGVAAHNTYWIKFGELRPGDQVVLATGAGRIAYRVSTIQVVDPEDRLALVQEGGPRLTLTTCWPLWAGAAADRRLVISATQLGFGPAAATG